MLFRWVHSFSSYLILPRVIQSAWEFLHKEHNRKPPYLWIYIWILIFLLHSALSYCPCLFFFFLTVFPRPFLLDCHHMPVLVWSCQNTEKLSHMHILTEASDSCLLKWMGLWIMTVPSLCTVEHWILFSSQLLICTKPQQFHTLKH